MSGYLNDPTCLPAYRAPEYIHDKEDVQYHIGEKEIQEETVTGPDGVKHKTSRHRIFISNMTAIIMELRQAKRINDLNKSKVLESVRKSLAHLHITNFTPGNSLEDMHSLIETIFTAMKSNDANITAAMVQDPRVPCLRVVNEFVLDVS